MNCMWVNKNVLKTVGAVINTLFLRNAANISKSDYLNSNIFEGNSQLFFIRHCGRKEVLF